MDGERASASKSRRGRERGSCTFGHSAALLGCLKRRRLVARSCRALLVAVGPSRRSVARAPFQSQQAIGPQKKTKEKKLCRVVVVVVDRSRSPPIAISVSLSLSLSRSRSAFRLLHVVFELFSISIKFITIVFLAILTTFIHYCC